MIFFFIFVELIIIITFGFKIFAQARSTTMFARVTLINNWKKHFNTSAVKFNGKIERSSYGIENKKKKKKWRKKKSIP